MSMPDTVAVVMVGVVDGGAKVSGMTTHWCATPADTDVIVARVTWAARIAGQTLNITLATRQQRNIQVIGV